MARECFFFEPGGALLCRRVRRTKTGKISGEVINGEWAMEFQSGEMRCFELGFSSRDRDNDGNPLRKLRNTVRCELVRTVVVPDHISSDYNAAIVWAEKQVSK